MMGLSPMSPLAIHSNGGAGYVVGVPRLGIPDIQMTDAAYGVRESGKNGRYSTALPANIAGAASWDPEAAYAYGGLIGRELRAQGYNMSLGGGVNIARELRNGRNFEYMGEDPILAGTMVGQLMKGEQAEHVIGDIKHYAVNDQESGRNAVNVHIDKRSIRETDLLAFEIGIRDAQPSAVMCSYNRVNGDYACENSYLLTDVLKNAWHFPGFVLSDWQGAHSTEKASKAGLDHEQPGEYFFGAAMKKAVESGKIPQTELNDHVHRILRSMFASGVVDDPPHKAVPDIMRGLDISQKIAEGSIVLLKNNFILPLDASKLHSIAVIGSHSDVGMISGGGSAQVDPMGGNAIAAPGHGATHWGQEVWFPTSPLKNIRAKAPAANVRYDSGENPATAIALAKSADVAIVFAYTWESEGMDLDTLSLPNHQDDLIAQVAAANPHTIVVLETGSAVTMPWADKVSGIFEAWYAGSRGAEALANLLFGDVNPSAKLPVTFPQSDADLPHTTIVHPPPASIPNYSDPDSWKSVAKGLTPFETTYDEGLKVGYKYYDAEGKQPLFPFGYGLSYTTFAYSNLKVTPNATAGSQVSFTLANTGTRPGSEVAEVYASFPSSAGEPPRRLIGWNKIKLAPGESKEVTINIDPLYLSVFNETKNSWQLVPGEYPSRRVRRPATCRCTPRCKFSKTAVKATHHTSYDLSVLTERVEFLPEKDREVLASVPAEAGVFLLRGEDAGPNVSEPYVTKTANLRRRLERLLGSPEERSRRLNLRERVRWIEYARTGSDFESGFLLYRLLREHFPKKYADRMRFRFAPLVRFHLENSYPRASVTTRLGRLGGASLYYGPFPGRTAAEKFLNDSLDFFKMRRCLDDLHPDPAFPGCIYSEMKMCLAPCFKGCTDEAYADEVGRVRNYLDSRGQSLVRELAAEREGAAQNLAFEEAAGIHFRMEKLKPVLTGLPEIVGRIDRLSGLMVQPCAESGAVTLFLLEQGQILGPVNFLIQPAEHAKSQSMESRVEACLAQLRLAGQAGVDVPASSGKTMEHLAILKRWYYRSSRVGEIFVADEKGQLPMRRVVRGIGRVWRGEKEEPDSATLA